MNNVAEIKNVLKARNFVKKGRVDSWHKSTWTIRFFEDDIEVYDSPEASRYYFLGNVNAVNIHHILDDMHNIDPKI